MPNLQSLIVSRLPFFDHAALVALRKKGSVPATVARSSELPLRLLIASNCENTTSNGLAEALTHFPCLVYLDLSRTLAARDRFVLAQLHSLPLLQVLKLRNVNLRDEDLALIAESVGLRVRSLDIRGNHLTDSGIRTLLSHCFVIERHRPTQAHHGRTLSPLSFAVEDWPSGLPRPDPMTIDEFKDASYDERLVRRLTSQIVHRLPFEDLPHSGITHLRVSDNKLSVEGVIALMRTKRLYVLDCGSIEGFDQDYRKRSESASSPEPPTSYPLRLPGFEKLTPTLESSGGSLTALRVDHTIVTESSATQKAPPIALCELEPTAAVQELNAAAPPIAELENTQPPMYELDSREQAPSYELQGDVPIIHQPPDERKSRFDEPQESEVRRGSIFAPEVVEDFRLDDADDQATLAASGLSESAQRINGVTNTSDYLGFGDRASELRLSLIKKQRRELRDRHSKDARGLLPGNVANIRKLTLTEVPSYAGTRKVVDALIQFLRDCATEAKLVDQQVQMEVPAASDFSRIGRASTPRKQASRDIFALKKLVLEMASDEPVTAQSYLSPHLVKPSKYINRTRSSTEDADSETFWSASENDFTFFDDEEECGLPLAETSSHISSLTVTEKMSLPDERGSRQPGYLPTRELPKRREELVDVVAELAKFRRERKAAYEEAAKRGVRHVEGYWPGEVQIIRGGNRNLDVDADDTLDYYGNTFSGGVYR